jgi:hypothetical protein
MNEKSETIKGRFRIDVIVISAILLISLLSLLLTFLLRKPGAVAVVEINGVTVAEYSLSKDGAFILNGGTNTLVIEGGEAYLKNSHCPDRTCELTGRVRYVGQTIVCLPNRLSVTVTGDTQNGVDFVS